MFRSELSGKQYGAGISPVKVVTETREKVYYDDKGREIGRGWEIVKEVSVGPDEASAVVRGR